MSSTGRMCLYCSKPVSTDDRVACCDRCYAVHHEDCWDRNGRCSTFRCAGVPRTMKGTDLAAVLESAFTKANEHPQQCTFCGGQAYSGALQGKRPGHAKSHPDGPGLLFAGAENPDTPRRGIGRLLGKAAGKRSWWLPGAQIRARSCGRCKRLFLWGVPIDEMFVQKSRERETERFCPHCSSALWSGEIVLNPRVPGGARFECDDAPDFHKDWLGHEVLDRFFLNRWNPTVPSLPAHSCPDCQYTEVAGRPVYRFL